MVRGKGKGYLFVCTGVGALIFWAAVAFADAPPGAGLTGTKHDFTTQATEAVGLCTFCHTPHKAITTRLLWNHTLSSQTYSWGDASSTTGGTPLPTFGSSYSGPSKNCLSCHDGSVAVGDVAWWKGQKPSAPLWDQKLSMVGHGLDVGTNGNMAGNHPVAIPYPYNNARNTYNNITTGTAVPLSEWQATPETFGIRLFHDVGTSGTANILAGASPGTTGVECSSCHDPHNGSTVQDGLFIRGKLSGSDTTYICLKCHIK